jgi:hypothetical protein
VRERQDLEAWRARGEKIARGLSNNSINHTLSDLAQVLEVACEYGLLDANPAAGKRRRLKSERPSRPGSSRSSCRACSMPRPALAASYSASSPGPDSGSAVGTNGRFAGGTEF